MLEGWRAGLGDQATYCRRTREADHGNIFARRQRCASTWAIAANDVYDAGRDTGFGENLHEVIRRQWRVFSGLQHDRIAADERRRHFPRRDGHRKVPRRDHCADANGLADAHGKLIGQLRGSCLAEQPPPFARHVIRHINGFLHVAARFRQDFAHLAGHVLGVFFFALHKQVRPHETEFPRASGPEPAAIFCKPVWRHPPPHPHLLRWKTQTSRPIHRCSQDCGFRRLCRCAIPPTRH